MTDRMELKTQKKEAAVTVNELLYLIFFGVMLFSKGMGWYDGMRPYQLCLLIGMGCLGLKLILTKYTPWQLLVAAVFGVLGVLSWRCSAEKGMLTCVMMLIGMKDVRIKKVFQVGAVVWSSVFLYRILAFLIGWDKGILLVHKKLGAFIFRWSMGYPHPNVFHISYVILLAFLFYLLQQKGKKLFGWIVAALVGNVLIFIYSVSFTGFLLTGIYLMLVLYFELRSQFTKPEKALVQCVLPAGLALFAGPSKAGKSWLTLWLCLQVAQGKPAWGREIESRTVLYLSLEDTLNRLQDRLFRLVGSEDTPEKLILQTECQSIGQGLEEQIVDFVHNYPDTGLVVIDTLQKVRSCDQSGSMYASDYKDVSALKSLADKYGICILLIHHLRKQAASDPFDQISGSNGLMGAADTTWVMQRKRTSKNADIILTGRDLERRTLYLHEENCIWLLDEEETAEEQRLKAVPEYLWRVAEYIEQAGKWQGTATELLSAAGVDGVLPHKLTRKIVEHFDTVFVPKDIHYETHRTSQTRLLKFSHSENDADDANDADIDITQLSGWDISKIASQASLASSAKPWRGKYGA